MRPGQENCRCIRCSWGRCCICGVNVVLQLGKRERETEAYDYLPGATRKVSEVVTRGEQQISILSSLCLSHRDSV